MRLGQRPTNKLLVARFRCTLRRGTYRYRVLASDLAGNPQTKTGSRPADRALEPTTEKTHCRKRGDGSPGEPSPRFVSGAGSALLTAGLF